MKLHPLYHDSLREFQRVHAIWLAHNFPNQTPHQALLGMVEEVGELAHAHLKAEQGIRGYDDITARTDIIDAIGDIFIYAASYCNTNNFDLAACLEEAWEEVKDRDWRKYPETGRPPVAE